MYELKLQDGPGYHRKAIIPNTLVLKHLGGFPQSTTGRPPPVFGLARLHRTGVLPLYQRPLLFPPRRRSALRCSADGEDYGARIKLE